MHTRTQHNSKHPKRLSPLQLYELAIIHHSALQTVSLPKHSHGSLPYDELTNHTSGFLSPLLNLISPCRFRLSVIPFHSSGTVKICAKLTPSGRVDDTRERPRLNDTEGKKTSSLL